MAMDIKQRKKILAHLAQKAEPESVALHAIQKEFAKITTSLQSDSQYDNIFEQIELLETIAYRVSEEAVGAIRDFLKRLADLKLTYEETGGYPAKEVCRYCNNSTLMVKALETLERIRYHRPSDILDIFFEYFCHEDEHVAKQAKDGIEKFAGYDLDIFYGDGENWHGLGWQPQEQILEKIASFDSDKKQKCFSAIVAACKQILSPTMSGTSSTYKTFTWRTAAVPAIDEVKKVRQKAIETLQGIYALAKNIEQKKAVLNALEAATRTPHMGEYGDDELSMIRKDSVSVLQFMKAIAVFDDMLFMQKIEHDAYWLFYRMGEKEAAVHDVALEIRDALYANKEYQIFRVLIGFESVFHDWERGKESGDFDREREFRESEALKLAENIDANSFGEWKQRIISYASIRSDDLATFPYFGKFLEHFGKTSPTLALQLLTEASDQLDYFIIATMCGISETEHKNDAYSLAERWCDEGKYLFHLVRFFEFSSEVNEELLKKILDKATSRNDFNTLSQIISSVSAHYSEENKHLVQKFFIPTLETLTAHKNSNWISGFWYRVKSNNILSEMGDAEYNIILCNLLWLQKIDYDVEEILCVIAERSPVLVIQFFCNRLLKKGDEEGMDEYDAVPFQFHKLSKPLSKYPAQAVDTVLEIYDGNNSLFAYFGARLLKNIFPNFPAEFQEKLLAVIQSEDEQKLLFVMRILENYDGNPVIYDVCKELVKILPDGSKLINQLYIILESTGVVSGEYGFVEAYKQKVQEIQPWLQDQNEKVKGFTQNYIESLEKRIEYEQKRADENIALRRHQYGESED